MQGFVFLVMVLCKFLQQSFMLQIDSDKQMWSYS